MSELDILDDGPPKRIDGWLHTQLSIARHYGGIKVNGHDYVIDYADPQQPLVLKPAKKRAKRGQQ